MYSFRLANRYDGNRYVKNFTCWNQLAVMMFGQLSNRESLRDAALATQALADKAYHLGFGKYATKSDLEEFAYRVIADARSCRATDIFKLNGHVYAFDSTTIELCLETFMWVILRKNQRKGGIKIHTLYDHETSIPTFFHITEGKVNDMNAMDISPMMVAELYHNRWQIELFFKWLKRHLRKNSSGVLPRTP